VYKYNENVKTVEYQKARDLRNELTDLVKLTCQSESTCKSLALGHKACGGPSSYLIYSTELTNEELLSSKVYQYNEYILYLQNKYEAGYASTCSFIQSPTLSCVNNLCQGSESY
ncbi:MAG: hypothetical protein KDK36_05280, partial [Leptospiraceae bacterium]|nr:hypothetical protein [Leptospiraceae bacterium]